MVTETESDADAGTPRAFRLPARAAILGLALGATILGSRSVLAAEAIPAKVEVASFARLPEFSCQPAGKAVLQAEGNYELKVQGGLKKPGWFLLDADQGDSEIRLDSSGGFEVTRQVRTGTVLLRLLAVGPAGETSPVGCQARFAIPGKPEEAGESGAAAIPAILTLGLGPTFLSFKQSYVDDYQAVFVTPKVSYSRSVFSRNWDLAGNAFLNALPITKDPSGNVIRVLGVNLRFGYSPDLVRPPWRFSLLLGAFYTHTIVTASGPKPGYTHLIYPQAYPTLRRAFGGGGASAFVYLKYVPMTSGFSLFSSTEREIGLGLGMSFPVSSFLLGISGDFSSMAFQYSKRIGFRVTATGLSLSLGF